MATVQPGPGGLLNKYRPTALSFNSYGWKGSPLYNRADVPSAFVEGVGSVDRTVIEQQLAYEWLNSSDFGGPGQIWTNPPFLGGAAGRLLPSLTTASGTPARILRGFIRRSEGDISDMTSMSRLYFMYNPETITRDYVSYLDQGALDPFNTVFQSGNLVAPPSYMDFTFSLFFDRQEEAMVPSNPGVFVDYQYFDLVVRNVIPTTDPNNTNNNTLPDNGVMMVNPRDITVVFSPQITVQGRPSNARVTFQKFTNRMVPTRMQIDLTMRVTYFGPLKDMAAYVKEEAVTAASIPFTDITESYHINAEDLVNFKNDLIQWVTDKFSGSSSTDTPTPDSPSGTDPTAIPQNENAHFGSIPINSDIVDYAKQQVLAYHTPYVTDSASWNGADCSGLVWLAFKDKNYAESVMGWTSRPDTSTMWSKIKSGASKGVILFEVDGQKTQDVRRKYLLPYLGLLQKGDLLYRINAKEKPKPGHVAWFESWSDTVGLSNATIFEAKSTDKGIGEQTMTASALASSYTGAFRPFTSSKDSVAVVPSRGVNS